MKSEARGSLGQCAVVQRLAGGCVVLGWAMEGDIASHGTLSAS